MRLLEQVRKEIRFQQLSLSTEKAYCDWIKRFCGFYNFEKHPSEMGSVEVKEFLTYLAVERNVAAATQNQAFSSLLFLYKHVIKRDLIGMELTTRAKEPKRLPVVLSHREAMGVINYMQGDLQLILALLYGSGMRKSECIKLRVKDLDFEHQHIFVRQGKGKKDRVTVMPIGLVGYLKEQVERVRAQHELDLEEGCGEVYLPYALDRKYPSAGKSLEWQYVFPSKSLTEDPRSHTMRRHHLHESTLNKSIKDAAKKAGIRKNIGAHTFRHSFATNMLKSGYDIRTIQELLGHANVETTMVYTHVLNRGGLVVKSPFDDFDRDKFKLNQAWG